MENITIAGRAIGPEEPPYLIAEAGVHHRNRLALALRYVDAAAEAGADAIKFQTYSADRLATRWAPAYWEQTEERSQHEVFAERSLLTETDYQRLVDHAAERGIAFLSTPFDRDAAGMLAQLGMPAFKIASADITHIPLLEAVAAYGRPVLLSTGASTLEEIRAAVDAVDGGGAPVVLLHCSLAYPTPLEDANLRRIRLLESAFPGRVLGYSDHTVPPESELACALAVGLGGSVIEKHFTLEPEATGDDHYHAVDPEGLGRLVRACRIAATMTPPPDEIRECETPARTYARRSIVASRRIERGEAIEEDAVDFKRPGTGLPAGSWPDVVGKRAARALEPDELILPDDLE